MMQIPPQISNPNKRYDFLLLYDVTDGNPNGDPDAGNLPRVDPETLQGIVTDVCLKRKIRNYIDLSGQGGQHDAGIFVRDSGIALNKKIGDAYEKAHPGSKDEKDAKKKERMKKVASDSAKAEMCQRFYDIRMFGGVLSTGDFNAGQVRGPMQLTFSRSIDPIVPNELAITRVAITKEGENKETEMGRKAAVPYGLYLARGFYSPALADADKGGTGVSEQDLQLFWTAILGMFENDRSAARGYMELQGAYIFAHENPLGNAPSGPLFRRIQVPPLYNRDEHKWIRHPRAFEDYTVNVADNELPEGVTLTRLIG
jgi:CRISPR-associated protein Csd2